MTEPASVLNLDEFYGLAHNPKVQWEGKQYELLLPDALGPASFLRYDALRTRFGQAADKAKEAKEDKEVTECAQALEDVIRELIAFISPALPVKDISFSGCMRILNWYNERAAVAYAGKKAASQPTGRKSMRGWLFGMASGSKR